MLPPWFKVTGWLGSYCIIHKHMNALQINASNSKRNAGTIDIDVHRQKTCVKIKMN